ncbi:cobalt ABC transporter ATP-binding protein [Leucobacter sp. OLJS4]|uniref:heavy metal translocating P-type ATPase n=1 Tax=Leucobacter sp. OLJS4 TaxID=1914922 RepID=UPI000C17E169|nr:heavy metal translocating P-type ATPase [Leucobacter sp. OLJS4]PIJ11616.1 cobalt ABC transporter ATP-binding protein [Leucobacter sp. OLJS4]
MTALKRALRAYPMVATTLLVAAVGLVLLATPVGAAAPILVGVYALLIAGWQAVGMIRSLIGGKAGLDILAVTAIVAAVLVGEPWAALVVVLMLTGGEALEDYAENRSKRELTALLQRAPRQATRVHPDPDATGGERLETVDISDIAIGDVLLVRPGELVPVDAVLLDPSAQFDESSLTGESLPVERRSGEKVASGVVNGAAAIRMRASALAADSQYQQIVALVSEAQQSRSRTVRLADRYAVPFTVLSLAIAGIAWAVSGEAVRFAEVLVVATPCPLLIAAPVAFLGGMSRAAKSGLIVKGGGTLEQLARVRSAAFDKTGTLTTGRPQLQRVVAAPGFTEDDVLQLAAAAEVYSSHVLAGAVVDAAKARGLAVLAVEEASESATNGVAAELAAVGTAAGGPGAARPGAARPGAVVRVGKPAWVAETAADLTRVDLAPGELAIYTALDDRFAGAIVMRDRLREEAPETLADLRSLGIERMLIVTGDVAATARPIGERLGIDEVHAECHPADKVAIVAHVQPRPLLMVGDGLNDAPVLAAADVGFAMGARGATAASESADVVNRFDRVSGVADAVRIGRDTVRIAMQSIWLCIVMSVALMLVAAFGFLPALLGAWLQEVVDLAAILGALRAIAPRRAC